MRNDKGDDYYHFILGDVGGVKTWVSYIKNSL